MTWPGSVSPLVGHPLPYVRSVGGRRVITDQVFPSADSDGVELFADGGSATLDSLKVRHLRSSWTTGHHNG